MLINIPYVFNLKHTMQFETILMIQSHLICITCTATFFLKQENSKVSGQLESLRKKSKWQLGKIQICQILIPKLKII
jgi:hypothetical protein